MAAADGVVYVPVDNLPETFATATALVGTSNFSQGKGEMVAIDLATGKPLWATQLPQLPFGGATVSNDLVWTTTFTGELLALSRQDGSIVWTAQLPAGSNATLAIVGNTLLAGAGIPLTATQHPVVVAYRPGM
jgi:outer membrane protein assembly factor BamB